jgi:Ca2+-binding EF-hand superfamily protein
VAEIHDNAEYKDPAQKPKNTIEKLFKSMDLNGDAKLDTEELMFRQYATGCEPMEAQVRGSDYLRCGDLDKDGMISLPEFNASTQPAWAHCVKDSTDRRAHGFLRFFMADADMDGKLTLKELEVGLIKLWGQPGDVLSADLMKCADKNKDGAMDQKEFHDSICAYNPATREWQMWNGTSDKAILECMKPAFKKFDASLVFHATDRNHDQKLSESEVYETAAAVNGGTVLSTTVDAIFKAADKDKKGFLSLEEFEKAGEAYKGANEATNSTAGLFLGGRARWPTDTYDEGYGMSVACHDRDGNEWRVFSDDMGKVTVTPKQPWNGTVEVKQR